MQKRKLGFDDDAIIIKRSAESRPVNSILFGGIPGYLEKVDLRLMNSIMNEQRFACNLGHRQFNHYLFFTLFDQLPRDIIKGHWHQISWRVWRVEIGVGEIEELARRDDITHIRPYQ